MMVVCVVLATRMCMRAVPSGPTRLVVDAHSDWQEGDLLEWERMERPMITELSQAATHLLSVAMTGLDSVGIDARFPRLSLRFFSLIIEVYSRLGVEV